MANTRHQLDKIIITAMDRFVWFVLLVVFSHLVTEFTRVTGYARGPRHDAVLVNDSLIRPIRVQNLVLYPGQEYGQYGQPNPSYYSGSSQYNNYDNNANAGNANTNTNPNNNNNNNFISNMFSGLFNQNGNSNNNNAGNSNNNGYNNNNGPDYSQTNSNMGNAGAPAAMIKPMGIVRPIIDSIFEIPISTLRAVNNLVGRLTRSYQIQMPYQQQQPQQNNYLPRPPSGSATESSQVPPPQQQQQPYFPFFPSLPSFPFLTMTPATPGTTPPSVYISGMQKSATGKAATASPPKNEIEMLEKMRQIGSRISSGSSSSKQQQQ
uniref:Uncharacterized protein n=1 Tax=Stomoxys calcitrans TaxID=35570 RepID=A0A1I8Q113_STOCA